MNFSTIIEPIKEHPYILLGGTAAVVLALYFLGGTKAKAAPASGSGVVTVAADPNSLALQASTNANATALSAAQISAQTQKTAIQAGVLTAQYAAQTQQQAASLNAQVEQTQTLGDILVHLAPSFVSDYSAQLVADSGSMSGAGGYGGAQPWGVLTPQGSPGQPVTGQVATAGGAGTPLSAQTLFNSPNFQLQQMFDNIIQAAQGKGPSTTAVVTSPSAVQFAALGADGGVSHQNIIVSQ